MARPDLDDDSELSILDTSDVDKAVKSVVRWLQNENTTRYFEQHPVARDAIAIAVREVTHSTAPATPTSTPYNPHTPIDQALTHLSPLYTAHEESDHVDQTSTLLLPLHIAQAERGDTNDSTDLHRLSGEAPDQTSPAAQQDLENGSHPPDYLSIRLGDKLDSEYAISDSQHSASLEVSTPATRRDNPRKRKHNFGGCGKFKEACIEVTDTTDTELGEKGLQYSKKIISQPVPTRDEQLPEMLEGAQNTQLSIAVTPPTVPEAAVTSRQSSEPPSATESATKLLEGESDRFVELPADLRSKLHTIGDESTLATIMDYAEYTANPPPSADYCADTLEDYQSPDTTSDQRFRVLPENLTMTDLHHLKRPQIQDFVDYIDLIRPGLKKEVTNLTGVLLQMVDTSRPAQRQLLDVLTSNLLSETRSRPPEELPQVANPSKLKLAQAVASPSFDEPYANKQLSHPQRIVNSVEGTHLDCSLKNSQWQPSSAGIEDENSPSFAPDCNECPLPSTSLGNYDEQSIRYMTDHCYSQDGDSREKSHFSDHERDFLDSQNGSLQQSRPGEEDFFDMNSYIHFSPQNTPIIASPSSGQYPGQDSLAYLIDVPRASTPLQNLKKLTNHSPLASELHIKQPAVNTWQDTGMPDFGKIWNAHDQENRTVNPRDLLQKPVQNYSTAVDYSTVQDYSTVEGSRNVEDPILPSALSEPSWVDLWMRGP